MPSHEIHGILALGLLLGAAIVAVLAARAARVPPIVGYIVLGALIGPSGFDWIHGGHELNFVAEFGVAFLLFDIGLHFSLKSLWETRHQLFGLGPLYWSLGAVALAGLLMAMGVGPAGAGSVGAALALSSNAVVLQTFADRNERDTPLGRTVTAVLIFQDLAAVLLLAAIGTVTTSDGSPVADIALALCKIIVAFAAVAVLGRAVRPIFRRIVQHEDEATFVAAALLLVLATAAATATAGLSLALGAFLAGMALSESEYCYRVKTEIRPFRGLLLGLFFLTVGMSLDTESLLASPGLVLGLLAAFVAVKLIAGVVSALLLRQHVGFALRLGFSLAQGSEFAFVIVALAAPAGLVSESMAAAVVAAVVLSMVATGAMIPLGERLGQRLERRVHPAGDDSKTNRNRDAHATGPRVILNGLGEVGRAVARAFHAPDIAYLALETDEARLHAGRADGFRVAHGNPWDLGLLETLGLSSARALILGDAKGRGAVELIQQVREAYPSVPILVRALDAPTAGDASQAGASVCVRADEPDPEHLAVEALRKLGVPEEKVQRWRGAFQPSEFERADKAHQLHT